MKLIVGLGNPGKKFKGTRHNVGFMAVEALREKLQRGKGAGMRLRFQEAKKFEAEMAKMGSLLLIKPQTFMNKSGRCISRLVNFYKVNLKDLYVIHDDLDIKLGEWKLQMGKGPKEHKGILSIEEALEGVSFWRVRVGVENRSKKKIPGERYVLLKFKEKEKETVESVLSEVAEGVLKKAEGK